MRRNAAWITACVVVASSSACASARAARLREQRLESELNALRYAQTPAEVWQSVLQLLADRGCPLAGADAEAVGQKTGVLAGLLSPAKETHPLREETGLLQQLGVIKSTPIKPAVGSMSLDTGWRKKGDRYHAEGLAEPDGFRVVFTRVQLDPSNGREERRRDLEMELALARRIEPQAAARIETAVVACLEARECTADVGGTLGCAASGDAVARSLKETS